VIDFKADRDAQQTQLNAMLNRQRSVISDRKTPDASEIVSGTQNAILGQDPNSSRSRQSFQHFRSWVYVCVDAIARRAAGQACAVGEVENAEPNPSARTAAYREKGLRTKPLTFAKSLPESMHKFARGNQELQVFQQHEALDLLARPNPIQRKFEFVYMTVANLCVTGEAYWVGGYTPAQNGKPGDGEIWAVPSNWIIPKHDKGLFTGFELRMPGKPTGTPLPPGSVARTFLPDPSDLKTAYSPLRAILKAIRVDDYIQDSQEDMFERGINPNLIVTIGKVRREDGSLSDRRPVLQPYQRRQLIRAVREIWNTTVNAGDPAILDGLIEGVHKLHNTPQEMDWPSSGEIVKKRVMQGFKVNPIVVGEVTAGNRAQAIEAEKNFCGNAVNPLLSAISETATGFIGPMFAEPKRLVVWFEAAVPTDPEQQLKEWQAARQNDDVTRDEFRANVLGISPLEERDDQTRLLNQQGGLSGIVGVVNKIASREITPKQGSRILQVTLRISAAEADEITGVGQPLPEPIDPAPPAPPDEESIDPPDLKVPPDNVRARLHAITLKSATRVERGLGRSLAAHFRRSVRSAAESLRSLRDFEPDPANAEAQAGWLISQIFDPEANLIDTVETTAPWLAEGFAQGVTDEVRMLDTIEKAVQELGTKTTAQEILERLELDLPEGVEVGEAPLWFREAVDQFLRETFQKPYWQEIDTTTANGIRQELERGLRDGHSVRRMAGTLNDRFGAAYSVMRATRVVRTEMKGALNAGHEAGIAATAEETGLPMGKEWVSVLGSTTRPSHAGMDGAQAAGPRANFTLSGYEIPYPGHGRLPAGERINCQCSVISDIVAEALEGPGLVPPETPPETPDETPPEIDLTQADYATLDAAPVDTLVAKHKGLQTKADKVIKAAEREAAKIADNKVKQAKLQSEIQTLFAKRQTVIDNDFGDMFQPGYTPPQSVLSQLIEHLDNEADAKLAELAKLRGQLEKLHNGMRGKILKPLSIPVKQRTRLNTDRMVTSRVQEVGEELTDWRDQHNYLRSTGKFDKAMNDRIGDGRDFFRKTVFVRETQQYTRNLTHLRVHSAEPGARAFYAGEIHAPTKPNRRGININPSDTTDIIVHEMGHHIEHEVAGVRRRADEFVKYRIAKSGTQDRNLRDLMGHGYDPLEKGNEDDFLRAFDSNWHPGKTYPTNPTPDNIGDAYVALHNALYTGKTYGYGGTELTSMGVQLLYSDAAGFAERDPEFFKFIVGVLDGTIR